jgi:DNA (cytosine-5)-methyltransferase 1
MQIPVIDVFAGPGGLNEGFSQFRDSAGLPYFASRLAAEMDSHAVATLRLRKFFRLSANRKTLKKYKHYVTTNDRSVLEEDEDWIASSAEVAKVELGIEEDNQRFDKLLSSSLKGQKAWVLLGGPPCQAYSNIRRWTYRTQDGFDLSNDHRAHLYQEYLRIIESFGPNIFVMENVKGILSSQFFERIINDLETVKYKKLSYRIHSLVLPADEISRPHDFLVKSEDYGVPQCRHRVILLGIREDIKSTPKTLKKFKQTTNVFDVLGDLPKLRSGFSKEENSNDNWQSFVEASLKKLCQELGHRTIPVDMLEQRSQSFKPSKSNDPLKNFLYEDHLGFVTNHETRRHISDDVKRYAYCALYGQKFGKSPRTSDFPLHLVPKHKNWDTGKFNDRFRVQLKEFPSTTITSHIAKDGHAYIHYDPAQARSLTVREAARLQTFPDNYHFEGPRTEQYKQVGNAVPPYLARQIAEIVHNLLS